MPAPVGLGGHVAHECGTDPTFLELGNYGERRQHDDRNALPLEFDHRTAEHDVPDDAAVDLGDECQFGDVLRRGPDCLDESRLDGGCERGFDNRRDRRGVVLPFRANCDAGAFVPRVHGASRPHRGSASYTTPTVAQH